LIEGKDQI